MTVFDLKKGDRAQVSRIKVDGNARFRLDALGLSVGTHIEVLGHSLFHSGVLISFCGVRLGMRKKIAEAVEVSL